MRSISFAGSALCEPRTEARFGGGSLSSALRSILPLPVSGNCIEKHKGGRNHVVGQFGAELRAAQRAQSGSGVRRFGHQIGDQPLIAFAVFAQHDDGLADAGRFLEQRFDLAGFDAMAAQLDLIIGAAQKLDVAIWAEARQIAGAINTFWPRERGNRNESARRSVRAGSNSHGPRRRRR